MSTGFTGTPLMLVLKVLQDIHELKRLNVQICDGTIQETFWRCLLNNRCNIQKHLEEVSSIKNCYRFKNDCNNIFFWVFKLTSLKLPESWDWSKVSSESFKIYCTASQVNISDIIVLNFQSVDVRPSSHHNILYFINLNYIFLEKHIVM